MLLRRRKKKEDHLARIINELNGYAPYDPRFGRKSISKRLVNAVRGRKGVRA